MPAQESDVEEGAGPRPPPPPQAREAEARWLAFLFAVTALLLVFQTAAGLLAGSLALLADCGHSAADVVSYGINYYVERKKVAAATLGVSRWSDPVAASAAASRADLVGCGASTVLLCVATVLAAREAMDRLKALSAGDGGNDFEGIGPALLAFAAVSTAANVGTLLIYRSWCAPATPLAAPKVVDLGVEPPPSRRDIELIGYVAPAPPGAPDPPVLVAGAPRRQRGQKSSLNLCGDFAVAAKKQKCQQDDSCADCAGPAGASWSSMLHMLVHPGCTDSHASCEGQSGEGDAPRKVEANLNVTAAMLHLWADVLRGITILVAAVLIEAHWVADAGRADAICALVVAAFVGVGSLALIQRMCVALRRVFAKPGARQPPVAA